MSDEYGGCGNIQTDFFVKNLETIKEIFLEDYP